MVNIICKCIAKLTLIVIIILLSPIILLWLIAMYIDRVCNYGLGVCDLNKEIISKTKCWLKREIKRQINVLNCKIDVLNEKLEKLEKLDDEENTNDTI